MTAQEMIDILAQMPGDAPVFGFGSNDRVMSEIQSAEYTPPTEDFPQGSVDLDVR